MDPSIGGGFTPDGRQRSPTAAGRRRLSSAITRLPEMRIDVFKPAEAPPGIRRLLPFLQESLAASAFSVCRILVAFARLSGVVRLLPEFRAWRARRHRIEAIVGIDLFGTSREALEVMLDELDAVYITRTADESCTFHPKMYLFEGERQARAIVGS